MTVPIFNRRLNSKVTKHINAYETQIARSRRDSQGTLLLSISLGRRYGPWQLHRVEVIDDAAILTAYKPLKSSYLCP